MRKSIRHKRAWRKAFALVPVRVKGDWVWLEWYYVSLRQSGDGLDLVRRYPEQMSEKDLEECSWLCEAGRPHEGTSR